MEQRLNFEYLDKLFEKSIDVAVRRLDLNNDNNLKATLFCIDGMVSSALLDEMILQPMANDQNIKPLATEREVMEYLLKGGAFHAFAFSENDFDEVIKFVMAGMAGIIFDEPGEALLFDVRTFPMRNVGEPTDEFVIKGAKEAFVEVIRMNTALVRRRIRSEHLVVEQGMIGRESKTDIAFVYMSNKVDFDMLKRMKKKLFSVKVDNFVSSAFIEEFICDNQSSLLPQTMMTERPDRFASNITDGRIGLIVDGIPFAYIIPCQLPALLQTPEDYGQNYIIGSALRTIRYISLIVSLLLPAFYIAITTFNSEFLPLDLALSIQRARINVPFGTFVEVLGLLLAFELLIEAGLRLPRSIGQAMSIVGALIIGQAAVEAHFVSPAVIIIVAATAVTGFTMPNLDVGSAIRVLRFALAVVTSVFGLLGLMFGVLFLFVYLCSLESYGAPYLGPLVGTKGFGLKDTFLRVPVRKFDSVEVTDGEPLPPMQKWYKK